MTTFVSVPLEFSLSAKVSVSLFTSLPRRGILSKGRQ